jgi:hypothetical protein
MKKLLSTLFGSTLIAGLLFGFIYFSDQARAYEPPLPDTSPELAILVVLPPEFTPADITSSLYCSRLEMKSASLALLSLWAKTSDGKLAFAHLQVTGDKATGWNMLFIAPKAFFIILKDIISKLEPRGDKRDILPTGPVDLASIAKLDAKVCNQIASSLLIRIVEKVEEKPGTVASVGPGESGTWPKEEIITCADGVRWERRTLMNGHRSCSPVPLHPRHGKRLLHHRLQLQSNVPYPFLKNAPSRVFIYRIEVHHVPALQLPARKPPHPSSP